MTTKFNFGTAYKKAEKEHNLGKGEYFKLQQGQNKIRQVAECLPHESEYQGKKNFKWLTQVLDRKDGKIKPFFMPNTIYRHIESLQQSEDYPFDGVPMPYDITITAIGAGTKEVKYTTTPARNNTLLTEEELVAIEEAPDVQDLQNKVKDNEGKKKPEAQKEEEDEKEEDVVISEIPF